MKKLLIAEIILLVLLIGVVAWVVIGYYGQMQEPPAQTLAVTEPSVEQTQPTTELTLSTTEQTQPVTEELPTEETGPSWVSWMTFPKDRQIQSGKYFVYDVSAGKYVFCVGAEERIYPASITKLFTYYVASQYLDPETVITVGEEIDMIAWDSTTAGLAKGDQLTVAELTKGLLLPSGNDVAYVLAANAGRYMCGDPGISCADAVSCFVEEMNAQAQYLGMTGSHFCNPDGIHDENHYMCVADLMLLGKLSLENPAVMEVTKLSKVRADFVYAAPRGEDYYYYGRDGQGDIYWSNTNRLINPESEYYCPFATGLKTGTTSAAGNCLLSSFDVEGRVLIIGVFGAAEYEDRFEDTLHLFNKTLGMG